MRATEVISSTPITVEKSVRGDEIRALTSCRAGKIVPLAFVPLLREDRVSRGSINLSFKMAETVHPLMNAVNVTGMAHLIPFSAFERFNGMDEFNRSYMGQPEAHNSQVIPFFETVNFSSTAPFWKTLGVHWKEGQPINSAPLEAYNLLVNWRRKARSAKLPQRLMTDTTLSQAFWRNPNMWHIVPDFDAAMMDGEVPLSVNLGAIPDKLAIDGFGTRATAMASLSGAAFRNSEGLPNIPINSVLESNVGTGFVMRAKGSGSTLRPDIYAVMPDIFAELRSGGISLSLANIELAKKTAAFAKLREQYSGVSEDHLMDLLMEGIRVPEEAMRQPILLARGSTIFGYTERHAMDGASLDKSVTTGETRINLTFRTPPMNTGGVIIVTAEIVPEQLFERLEDRFLAATDPAKLPSFLRDFLDPEKVEVVQNKFVDVEHATPTHTFGYAPLNHAWKRSLTRIGGRYYRRNPDTFVEDRQRFWSVEKLNPSLTADFYLVPENLPHTVFMDAEADPFEVLSLGNVEIVGNTVFGKMLTEDEGHYDAVMSKVDTSRIAQEEI